MKKNKNASMGVVIPNKLRIGDMTFYQRGGQVVGRVSNSMEKRSNTLPQFIQRQKLRHTTALWKMLRFCEPMFTQRKTAYGNFVILANRMPAVYVPCKGELEGASFLMPGMPVSDGMLPDIECRLGQVEGRPALLTSLRLSAGARSIPSLLYGPRAELKKSERLCLFRLRQRMPESDPEAVPRVAVRVEMLDIENCRGQEPFAGIELMDVDGRLALVGDTLGDDTMGWALVRMDGDNVSSQRVVTRCRLYEQYITDPAQERAAKSYGGLTPSPYLMPNGN